MIKSGTDIHYKVIVVEEKSPDIGKIYNFHVDDDLEQKAANIVGNSGIIDCNGQLLHDVIEGLKIYEKLYDRRS